MVNIVNCPHCKQELYRTKDNADGVPEKVSGPSIDFDKNPPVMVCPHPNCRKEVVLNTKSELGKPVQLSVSDIQPK